ncbi:phage tail protein [Anaerobacillus sp. HL2]|nr:phage tail protein [Anaerobacillus sp. HL2]
MTSLMDFNRGGSGRWAIMRLLKTNCEFVGPGQEDVTLTILLSAHLGVNPQKELQKLRKMRDNKRQEVLS